jgi:FKBP-type peptidyl-prolyl cis-trans isomerase 2
MTVKKGDKVKVEYTGTFENGEVFDTSKHEGHSHPIEFEVGAGKVVPGFDKAIEGMELNETKKITLQPEEAYGEPSPQLAQKIPREQLPKEPEAKPGMMLGVTLPNGQQLPAKITEVTETEVTLDLNHPLAGKVLNFEIQVVGIN